MKLLYSIIFAIILSISLFYGLEAMGIIKSSDVEALSKEF